jgi:hypothetical protein
MSAPVNPPRTRGSVPGGQPHGTTPHLRVSDAERTQAADQLAKHYADGRLDEATFNARLDQAMSAKTGADLSALFTDLPGGQAPRPAAPAMRGRRPRRHRILLLVLIIVIAAAAGDALAHSFIPWLLLGLLAIGWLRYGPRPSRRG